MSASASAHDVIYHGLFGTGLFQTIYRKPASHARHDDDEHRMAPACRVRARCWGWRFRRCCAVAGLMFLTPIFWSCVAGMQAPRPSMHHWLSRPLIAWLHYRQPIVRGWARYSVRLKNKVMVMRKEARGYRREQRLPFDPHDQYTLQLLEQGPWPVRAAGKNHR